MPFGGESLWRASGRTDGGRTRRRFPLRFALPPPFSPPLRARRVGVGCAQRKRRARVASGPERWFGLVRGQKAAGVRG